MSSVFMDTWYFTSVVANQLCHWNDETGKFLDTLCFLHFFKFSFSVVSQSLLRGTLAKGLLDDKGLLISFENVSVRIKQTQH